jgi:hypothetical protein
MVSAVCLLHNFIFSHKNAILSIQKKQIFKVIDQLYKCLENFKFQQSLKNNGVQFAILHQQ